MPTRSLVGISLVLFSFGFVAPGCGGSGTADSAADFQSLSDFVHHPVIVAATKAANFGVCQKTGAPDITGVYRPQMTVTACGGCSSSVGNRNDPSERVSYCYQKGDDVAAWVNASTGSGAGAHTVVALCDTPAAYTPGARLISILGVTEGVAYGCSMTTVNLWTGVFWPNEGVFGQGDALDVVVALGSECAGLGVTTKVGHWFHWQPSSTDHTPMARVGEGPYPRNLPTPCGSYFDQPCGGGASCRAGTDCLTTTLGDFCMPAQCQSCFNSGKKCRGSAADGMCSFDQCG